MQKRERKSECRHTHCTDFYIKTAKAKKNIIIIKKVTIIIIRKKALRVVAVKFKNINIEFCLTDQY